MKGNQALKIIRMRNILRKWLNNKFKEFKENIYIEQRIEGKPPLGFSLPVNPLFLTVCNNKKKINSNFREPEIPKYNFFL